MESFGSLLRQRRVNAGLSQQGLADRLGHVQINQSRVSEMEHGRLLPDRAQEHAIGDVLDLSVEDRALAGTLIADAETQSRLARSRGTRSEAA
jgi:transcriptional regulator with XRE-family HTH domain